MNDTVELSEKPGTSSNQGIGDVSSADGMTQLFQRVDWLSFGITAAVALSVYLLTLAPDVTLKESGIYSTGAMYGGVPFPPGHPVWVVYSWIFTKLLPFSNIAWRAAVGSAVAGALTCGIVALMVSRGAVLVLDQMRRFRRLAPKEENLLRIVCGYAVGLGFGFDGCVWSNAVVIDTRPLGLLLFSIVLCLLMRWVIAPDRKRCLYAASLFYGLTLADSQLLLAAAAGLQISVAIRKPSLGRDIFFADVVICVASWVAHGLNGFTTLNSYVGFAGPLRTIVISVGIGAAVLCAGLTVLTRSFFTEWKTTLLLGVALCFGLLAYFYLPIVSMTNPPMNWGYARTPEGFSHLVTRGQFEHFHLTESFHQFVGQIQMYGKLAIRDFGIAYLLAAIFPLFFLHRINAIPRVWLFGLLAIYLSTTLLMVWVLNPSNDRSSLDLITPFFASSHLVLAIFAGYGLTLAGSVFARPKKSNR